MSKSDFHTISVLKLWVRVLVFSVLNVYELICGLTHSRNLKKQCMYMKDIFLKTPLLIYVSFFPNFFPQFKLPNSGCGLSVSAAYTPVFTVRVFSVNMCT